MIVNTDAKSLELCAVADLSSDDIMLREINENLDLHSLNQDAFKLPSRLIAKTFVFR